MHPRVCAVVVTYNRKNLLRACLDAILAQSLPPDDVLVVNNASTDGTHELLEAEYADKVHLMHMAHNVGGSGGFFRGMKWAYDNGADWLWIMDDDGVPDETSLAEMMAPKNTTAYAVMNPLVVHNADPSQLSFGIDIDGEMVKSIETVVERTAPDAVVFKRMNPFNGTLISRKAVSKVGYPKREMFIWGDEVDWVARLDESGLPFATIVASVQRHPPPKGGKVSLGPFGTIDTMAQERIGIAARNLGYLYGKHRNAKLRYLKPIVVALYYFLSGNARGGYNFLRYYVDGYFDAYRFVPSRQELLEQSEQFDFRPRAATQRDTRMLSLQQGADV